MEFSDVFEIGMTTEFIRQSDLAGHEVKGKDWLLENIYAAIDSLATCEIEDDFVFESMWEWTKRLNRTYKKGERIKKKDGKELAKDAGRWQDLIYKELSAKPCIEFQKGALNQKALVLTSEGKPSAIFSKKVWKALPKIAQSDFSDAAKCLLVGASTAATMVTLRGIEAVVRKYYSLKTKRTVGKKNLGDMLKELQEMPPVNKKLIGYIDYIRSEKRNIAQHPTKVFNQREAERIFMEIVSATHDIHAEIISLEDERQKQLKKPS